MSLPCIVCGRRRGHDREYHHEYRRRYLRVKNLLERRWPALRGLARINEGAPAPARRSDLRFYARVLPSGEVVHLPVRPGDRGYEEAS